jgi:hypothetical protein
LGGVVRSHVAKTRNILSCRRSLGDLDRAGARCLPARSGAIIAMSRPAPAARARRARSRSPPPNNGRARSRPPSSPAGASTGRQPGRRWHNASTLLLHLHSLHLLCLSLLASTILERAERRSWKPCGRSPHNKYFYHQRASPGPTSRILLPSHPPDFWVWACRYESQPRSIPMWLQLLVLARGTLWLLS